MTVTLLPSPSEEQAMLLDASVRFMEAAVPLATVRERADGADHDDAGYRRAAAELGWFGLLADEARGGGSASGNGVLDAALVAAERGARLQPGPYPGHSAVVHALDAAAAVGAEHEQVLGELVSGAAWATWAFDSGASCELRAVDRGLELHGEVPVVAEADLCAWLLVTARSADGLTQVLVPADAAGVTVRRLEGLDVSRHWGAVRFDGVAVGAGDLVGTAGPASERLVAEQARLAAVLTAAESVGTMRADLDAAVQYAKDRVAFGRPIGSFQAVKHLLADLSLWAEMATGLVVAAATSLGHGDAGGPEQAHAAKAFVAEKGIEVAHGCFQVFGGIGYTWEHDQHLHLRRLAADAESFGSAAWHRSQLLDAAGVSR